MELYDDGSKSVYNSGNIKIEQNDSKLYVTINSYDFNEKFPKFSINNVVTPMYTENIGTFCVGYIQIFVPDTEASTIENRSYYLTVSDNNMSVTSCKGEIINTQMNTFDDNITNPHYIYKPGSYAQNIGIYNKLGQSSSVESRYGVGDGKVNIGDTIMIQASSIISASNDYDIYTANRFIKFDGEAFEPIYFDDGSKF